MLISYSLFGQSRKKSNHGKFEKLKRLNRRRDEISFQSRKKNR